MSGISALKEEAPESSFAPLPQCEDTAEKRICEAEEELHQITNLLAPLSWTLQPPEL